MMKVQFASDLHLELPANARWLAAGGLDVAGDVLLLGGDIAPLGMLGDPVVAGFLDWCDSHYRATWWVPGNHEYYGPGSPDVLTGTPLGWRCDVRPRVHLCNGVRVALGSDADVLLATMWTPVRPENEQVVNEGMTDCSQVMCGGHLLRAADYVQLHHAALRWMEQELAGSDAKHKIVVTHHCPVLSEDPAYASNGLSDAFVADLAPMVARCGAERWLFGHTHYNAACGQQVGGCTLLTNQLGQLGPGGQPCLGFSPAMAFEVQ